MMKGLDSELWHACAGSMVQMPPVSSKVFYFPQGHAEHTLGVVDFEGLPRIPPSVPCRVDSVRFLADPESDEVFAKIRLVPVDISECEFDSGVCGAGEFGSRVAKEKNSFAKTLTQSDANNGGGFSVPRYCAETIFPKLDFTADPPVQNVVAKDVHGESWKFRHIYRGTPRRHLLTTGWSNFVNQKKLVAGDSIVFLKSENEELFVGIRRAKKGSGSSGGECVDYGWNTGGSVGGNGRGKVKGEAVIEAAYLAANRQPFEVLYYPRTSTPEFCVKASVVSAAMRIQWFPGMRFKMPFETEDSSRISWFMGTVASVRVADPVNWPTSPWRMLQVTWDEPDLLQNVKCVNPWLVETVSNIPVLNLSPFSPQRKKLRVLNRLDFPIDNQFRVPSFSGNPLGPSSPVSSISDSFSAGIQGARHAQIGVPFSDLRFTEKQQMGLLPSSFLRLDPRTDIPRRMDRNISNGNENVSCLLSIGNSSHKSEKKDGAKTPSFVLFGQPIHTEQHMTSDSSCAEASKEADFTSQRKDLPKWFPGAQILCKPSYNASELGLDTGHCKVFLESEDVGRTLDLSVIGSYEELHKRLVHMFGLERSEMLIHAIYRDATGAVKQIGDEPFSEFMKTAKRLTIRTEPSVDNAGRKLITGLPTSKRGLDSSNQSGPLSIFA